MVPGPDEERRDEPPSLEIFGLTVSALGHSPVLAAVCL
jgi:hypothetical protein